MALWHGCIRPELLTTVYEYICTQCTVLVELNAVRTALRLLIWKHLYYNRSKKAGGGKFKMSRLL